jgi:hypothetical protein
MGFTIDKDKGEGLEPSDAQQPHSPIDRRSGKGTGKWIKAITYSLLFLAVLVLAGLVSIDHVLREGKRVKPEASAISSLRILVTSQVSYSETIGDGTYADSLGSLYGSMLIDSMLASGTKDGYTFTVSTGTGDATYGIYARPITYDGTGIRSFYSDQTGVIRYTGEDRPATVDDKPLGQ